MASAALTEALTTTDTPQAPSLPAPIAALQSQAMLTQISEALPRHMDADAFRRSAITLVKQNPKLLECDPVSVAQSIVRGASLGLDPDPVLGQMYLVPRNTKTYNPATRKDEWHNIATFQIGYKGLYELAMRTGKVAKIEVAEVREHDHFVARRGTNGGLDHQPDWFGDRGPVIGWYAFVRLTDGAEQFAVLNVEQAEAHRDAYAPRKKDDTIYGPWVDNFGAMAEKTVFIKAAKWIPKSKELTTAFAIDAAAVASVPDDDPEPDPTPPAGVDTSTGEINQGDDAPASADDSGDPIETTATPGGSTDPEQQVANVRKMWAIANEIWAGEHTDTIDGRRKGAISAVTKGRTESSKGLAPAEWFDLFDALDLIKNGAMELHQRATGEWEIKAPRRTTTRKAS
jgi:recombination protein RecT